MNQQQDFNEEFFGNLLLISGNGRNVGKTFFACRTIEYLSQKYPVTAVKISPHFHKIPENADVLFHSEDFTVINETKIIQKDSSLFLQAGAAKVLFVMAGPENLENAFQFLNPLLTEGPVICETAGLGEIINAGLSFFLKKPGEPIVKNQIQAQLSHLIENDGQTLDFDITQIGFENNHFFLKHQTMSKFSDIEQQISNLTPVFEVEAISLKDAFGRVIQEDVLADTDMPPFRKSAMDGYACRMEDIQNELEVLEIINAGKVPSFEIAPNTCSKIMTGAMIPAGADCVFKIEESELTGVNRVLCTNPKTKTNICQQGEDYKTDEVLLTKGTIVNVSQMAVLAGAGYSKIRVSALPKVAVIATGSELVEPQIALSPGKIRNSNASQLVTQLKKINIPADYLGIATDDFQELTKIFSGAIEKYDYLFFTGGASNGDFDLIPGILKAHNFSLFWNNTGIKPGNPMTFAQRENKFCFGLSGNPVSSMVQFEMIVKPVVYQLLGANYQPLRIKTGLAADYRRRQADRLELVPVAINTDGQADLIPFNGAAHINALAIANALMEVPQGKNELLKGEMVYVRPL